jgi:hypothetical protein
MSCRYSVAAAMLLGLWWAVQYLQLWCEQLNSWDRDLRGEVDQLLKLS